MNHVPRNEPFSSFSRRLSPEELGHFSHTQESEAFSSGREDSFRDVILNETIIHGGTKIILGRLFGYSFGSIRERFTARYNSLFLKRNGRCYLYNT